MIHEYKTLNEVQTHLITWCNPFNNNGKDVIICITGNPGITDFYIEFGSTLYELTELPVCVIVFLAIISILYFGKCLFDYWLSDPRDCLGRMLCWHYTMVRLLTKIPRNSYSLQSLIGAFNYLEKRGQAGGEEVPDCKSNVLHNQTHLFNLEGQIAHKLDLIKIIDKKSKIHLIGHSIGAWMILNAIRKDKNLIGRIASVNLLFPTIQRMAATKNGIYLNKKTRHIHWFVMLLVQLIYFLPENIRLTLIRWYLKFNSLSSSLDSSVLKLLNPKVVEKVLHLAYDEMDTVTTLDKEVLRDIKHLTNVIYGSRDNWAPVSYMDDLKEFEPQIQMKEVDIDHSFVLKSSETVAEMVSCFIKEKITRLLPL